SLSRCLTNSSTSPVISLSRNAWRTWSTISVVAVVPTSARYKSFSSLVRKSLSTRPLSRKSWATPVKTLRVFARPCLILLKKSRNPINYLRTLPLRQVVSIPIIGRTGTGRNAVRAAPALRIRQAFADIHAEPAQRRQPVNRGEEDKYQSGLPVAEQRARE